VAKVAAGGTIARIAPNGRPSWISDVQHGERGSILRQSTLDHRDCLHTFAFENGFHWLINGHHPEAVSPKLRGELSSI